MLVVVKVGAVDPVMFQLQFAVDTDGFMVTLVFDTVVPTPIHNKNARLVERPKKPP